MIDPHTALFDHLFQVAIAERISQIPAYTKKNDVLFKSVSFEVDHRDSWLFFVEAKITRNGDSPLTQQNLENDQDSELADLEMDTRPEDVLAEIERLQQRVLSRKKTTS
jgi:hypothetical protein